VVLVTVAAKALRVPDGADATAPSDYFTDEADVTEPAGPQEVALA
jgi:hypothetical protein